MIDSSQDLGYDLRVLKNYGVVAQLDRAPGFGPGGRGFESFRPHHKTFVPRRVFCLPNTL